jgi:uncharacterized protein YegL
MSDKRVREHLIAEQGQLVMPFYIICDVSSSMHSDIAALSGGVERLRRAIIAQPVVDDIAQICVISFADTARVLMPLRSMSESTLPRFATEGGTNYGPAFRLLAKSIVQDTADLKSQGHKVYRPCAFFLTDGEPKDSDWHATFTNTLTYDPETGRGLKVHPVFVPFGFGNASESVLKRLAYPQGRARWYRVGSMTIEQALASILDVIMQSIIASAHTDIKAGGEGYLKAPDGNPFQF